MMANCYRSRGVRDCGIWNISLRRFHFKANRNGKAVSLAVVSCIIRFNSYGVDLVSKIIDTVYFGIFLNYFGQ